MNLVTALAICLMVLLGIGTVLNAELAATAFPVATGFATVNAPVILVLVIFAAGSWFLFLLLSSVSQDILLRRIERLSGALAEKDRELLRVKATAFDESMETLQNVAARLDRRLRDLEPLLAGRRGEAARHAGPVQSAA